MKLIIAIIQPSKVEAVKEALNKVEVFRLTMIDCRGFGRQKGHSEVYRGHELTVQLLNKVQLQVAVNEDFVEPTVNAIMEADRTGPEGRIGDGKIFILPLEDCIRIRTGERGPECGGGFIGWRRRDLSWRVEARSRRQERGRGADRSQHSRERELGC